MGEKQREEFTKMVKTETVLGEKEKRLIARTRGAAEKLWKLADKKWSTAEERMKLAEKRWALSEKRMKLADNILAQLDERKMALDKVEELLDHRELPQQPKKWSFKEQDYAPAIQAFDYGVPDGYTE